ncbi:hypothetical protein ACIRBX_38015 [Kitasatospora sp. NPDC096147]|uniref:hypothetical protein n=1 Tax=Kitasatospora sp. NPDC096147 TaxID=3364093 RepID=UPI0038154738
MFSEMWSDVWWPWSLLWLLTAASLLALPVAGGLELRRRRRRSGLDLTARICVYLDHEAVMNLYRVGRYTEALTQQVEERTSGGRRFGADAPLPLGAVLSAGLERGEERVRSYVREQRPMDVIGVLVEALERVDGIVHADLGGLSVRENPALVRSFAPAGRWFGKGPAEVRLSEVDAYVLLRGTFRMVDPVPVPGGSTVFLASYGPVAEPWPAAVVRVGCATAGLSGDPDHHRTFTGYCLGMVKEWNGAAGVLEVRAVAIFD